MKRHITTLTNGKKVANFSSPHEFKFTDGSILPAVSDELAETYYDLKNSPFRSVRIEDRIKKLVSIHKQCV